MNSAQPRNWLRPAGRPIFSDVYPRLVFALAAAAALAGCGHAADRAKLQLPTDTRHLAPSTLLRVPHDGGHALVYDVPDLNESSWEEKDRLPDIQRLVGPNEDQHVVYLLDTKNRLLGLDLRTERSSVVLDAVRLAAVSASGDLFAVDTAGSVIRVARRAPSRLRGTVPGSARAIYGTAAGEALVRTASGSAGLQVMTPEAVPSSVALPAGPSAASEWGDLVAVGTDTGLVLYAHEGLPPFRMVDVNDVQSLTFSPSGHRIYALAKPADRLLVIDRFGRDVLDRIRLPGPAAELRTDRFGRWLLVRPSQGDSVWVVDPATGKVVGSAAGAWSADLPAVVDPNTLITRVGKDVVARDLSEPDFKETGRVAGGAADLWTPLAWSPGEPDAAESDTTSATSDGGTNAGPIVYLQVSSSQNGDWAKELAGQLRGQGLPATVLPPRGSEDPYRVVLGPYHGRAAAEAAAQTLGRPSFIVPADSTQ